MSTKSVLVTSSVAQASVKATDSVNCKFVFSKDPLGLEVLSRATTANLFGKGLPSLNKKMEDGKTNFLGCKIKTPKTLGNSSTL